jgi:hypothetical protein
MVALMVQPVMGRIVSQILMQRSVLIASHGSVMSVVVDLLTHLSVVLQIVMQIVMHISVHIAMQNPAVTVTGRC